MSKVKGMISEMKHLHQLMLLSVDNLYYKQDCTRFVFRMVIIGVNILR